MTRINHRKQQKPRTCRPADTVGRGEAHAAKLEAANPTEVTTVSIILVQDKGKCNGRMRGCETTSDAVVELVWVASFWGENLTSARRTGTCHRGDASQVRVGEAQRAKMDMVNID